MGKVLAVDDDHGTLRLVRAVLEGAGHQVVTTDNPLHAVDLAREENVDAVVLDVVMPERSGYEVLGEIRHDTVLRDLPVLMLSNLSGPEDRVRGLREGADDYVGKPLEPEELVLRIERLIERAAAARAHFRGSFEHFSLIELLQQLELSAKTGSLLVECGAHEGSVWLKDGQIVGASLAGLTGKDACCAMMQLANGRFRFEISAGTAPHRAAGETPVSIQLLVLEEARLMDELCHRQPLAPGTVLWPVLDGQGGPPGWGSSLPLREVWTWISDRPGVSREALLGSLIAAPRQTDVALAILIEEGTVRAEAPAEPHRDTIEIAGTGAAADDKDPIPTAVEAVLRGAAARGFAPSLVPILLALSRPAATSLRDLIAALPEHTCAGVPRSLEEALHQGREADVRLRQNVGTVLLRLQLIGAGQSQMRAESLLPGCAGVIVWPKGEASSQNYSWLLPRVENFDAVCQGVLIGPDPEDAPRFLRLLEGTRKWRLHPAEPTSLAGILRLFAEALWSEVEQRSAC